MASDSEAKIFVWSIAGLFAGIYFFVKGFIWWRQKKMIEDTPTSKVRSIAMGHVEVYGKAVPIKDKILKSPFSSSDCVYYKFTIEEYRRSNKNSHWVTIKSGEEGNHFYLKDDTGKVLIDPNKAEVDIPADMVYRSGIGHEPPKPVMSFLKKSNLTHESFIGFNKTMRYTEYYIAPDDRIYVLGTAGSNPFTENSRNNEEGIMIYKGRNFYYISDRPEKDILDGFKWKVIGGLLGGSALIIVCLLIIFGMLGLL